MKFRKRERLLFILMSAFTLTLLLSSLPLLFPSIMQNASAVTVSEGVGVYWDSRCTNSVTSINWGTLRPTEVRAIYVYVRNEQGAPVILLETTSNWNSALAAYFIDFSWDYSDQWLNPNEVINVKLVLSISPNIQGVTNFSFTINVLSSLTIPGDLNSDGTVDYADVFIFLKAYGSTPDSPNWNPAADINDDNIVNYLDLQILLRFYGR